MDVITSWQNSDLNMILHWLSIVLSKDMTDRHEVLLEGLVFDKLIHLELFAPPELGDNRLCRILCVELPASLTRMRTVVDRDEGGGGRAAISSRFGSKNCFDHMRLLSNFHGTV